MTTTLEKTIEIIFQGDDRSINAFKSVNRSLADFEGVLTSVTGPLASVADDILKVDATLAALSTGALAYSLRTFADFEDVMLKVKGVIGANQEEYERLTQLTQELGATTRYTATEAAQGLEFLALAGFTVEDAIGSLPQVLQLAQASATDLGRAADIVTNIMAGYGVEVEDLASASDVLTATFTNSNTSLDQLGQAFKFVGPVAKTLGLEIEETSSLLGILANAGYQAEMGGTALRNILLALVAPAGNFGKLAKELGVDTAELGVDLADSANALKSLGVEVKAADGSLRSFPDIMDDMKAGLDRIPDSADRAAILIEIFGKRGGPQMAALLEQGSGAVIGLETKIRSLGGVTAYVAEEMESGIGGAARAMRSAMEAIAIEIGSAISSDILPAASGIVDVFRTIAKEVEKGSFDPLFDVIAEFSDEMAQTLDAVADALPEALSKVDYSALTASFEKLIGVAGDLFAAVFPDDLTTVDGLTSAIQKVVNAWATLNDITSGILQSWEPVFHAIGAMIQQLSDAEGPLYEFAVQIGNMFGSAQVIDRFVERFGLAGTAIAAFFNILAPGEDKVSRFNKMMADGSDNALKWEDSVGGKTSAALSRFLNWISPATAEASEFNEKLNDINETEVDVKIQVGKEIDADLEDASKKIEEYDWRSDPVTLELIIGPDSKEEVKNEISDIVVGYRQNGDPITMPIELLESDKQRLEKEVDELVSEKILEIQIKGDIEKDLERIRTQAETIQTAMEWEAKVEIADIEAAAKKVEAAFESINVAIEDTGSTLSSLFEIFAGVDKWTQSDQWRLLRDAIEQEMKLREQSFELQKKQVEAEIALTEARTDALNSGEALISVNGDGLQPHLEAIMWEIFAEIQARANRDGLSVLLLGGE